LLFLNRASFSKRPKKRDDVVDVVIRDLLPALRLEAPADRDLVQLFVVPWDVNRKNSLWIKPDPRDRNVQLEKFVCIDADFLFEDLREVEELKGFKAADGTCQYAGGLPNNARIVVLLPAPPAPATAPVPGECYHILTSTKYSASCTCRTVPNPFPFSRLLFAIPICPP
jgi:hypothetical protein